MKTFFKQPFSKLTDHLGMLQYAMQNSQILDIARQRLFIASTVIFFMFLVLLVRLSDVMLLQTSKRQFSVSAAMDIQTMPRADIYDRHGNMVATHLITASVYANPKVVLDPENAAQKLATLFPEIGYKTLYNRLSSSKGFTWLARHIPPKLQNAVNQLGIPGVYLQKDHKRVYPYGNLLSHILGYCGLENKGLAGVEKEFDTQLSEVNQPLRLSLDVRIQHIVRDVLIEAVTEYKANGANAMVVDIKTGQILAMVSVPDFNPHQLSSTDPQHLFNRNTLGVNEPGSTFKILNTAIALETGVATLQSAYDVTMPIKVGRFKITDFKAKSRVVDFTQAFVYSSNIAAAKVAQQFGIANQKYFFKKFGVFDIAHLELPEIGSPLIPKDWRSSTLISASFGYGISVTPLQIISIIGSIINDGVPLTPTLLYKDNASSSTQTPSQKTLVAPKTSRIIREMMRMATLYGGSRKANVKGYEVFAKTGTAYQSKGRSGYNGRDRTTSCLGAFPLSDPKVMVIVMLDSPKATQSTYNYAAAGWNAAPTFGKIVERIAPTLGIFPSNEETTMRYVHWYEPPPGANLVSTNHTVITD